MSDKKLAPLAASHDESFKLPRRLFWLCILCPPAALLLLGEPFFACGVAVLLIGTFGAALIVVAPYTLLHAKRVLRDAGATAVSTGPKDDESKGGLTTSRGTEPPIDVTQVLLQASQLLLYKAESRTKLEAQVTLTQALMRLPGAARIRLAVLRVAGADDAPLSLPRDLWADDFQWLLVKTGSAEAIAALGSLWGTSQFEETFRSLFGEQTFDIVWADNVVENVPGAGQFITSTGKQRYDAIARGIRDGRFAIDSVPLW